MILIIGNGVAGLSCALEAAKRGAAVELVSGGADADAPATAPHRRLSGNTALAQGGIAAAIGDADTWASHLADTCAAGAGLVDRDAATVLTRDGATAVRALIASGFPADRDAAGVVTLGLEAAHARHRIVHAGGDRSGAALQAYLERLVRAHVRAGRITWRGSLSAQSLFTEAGAVTGAALCDSDGTVSLRRATAVVLATGGYAGLYPQTSNHPGATGSGIVLASRAGAAVADLEFVQFHPTVLHGTGVLVSEAVRGAGAVLLDASGARFMAERHERAELAPRDVVSRETHRVMGASGAASVWLDATGIERSEGEGSLARRFPSITQAVARHGFDWARAPIPVSPAAHYSMGGVVSDIDGRSTVPGLLVAGEVAATGVHGANRLASNSLLEGLVFGQRAGRAAAEYVFSGRSAWHLRGAGARALAASAQEVRAEPRSGVEVGVGAGVDTDARVTATLQQHLGIERDADGLRKAEQELRGAPGPRAALARMVQHAASRRTESRGAHQRADYPHSDPDQATRTAFRWVSDAASQPDLHPQSEYHPQSHAVAARSAHPC